MSEGSDVISRPARLDRGTIGIAVLILSIAASLRLGVWWGDSQASAETGMTKQLNNLERVFTERDNLRAKSLIEEMGKIRLEMQQATATLLTAIHASGERVSLMDRDIRTWVALLDAQNTITVPAFGK